MLQFGSGQEGSAGLEWFDWLHLYLSLQRKQQSRLYFIRISAHRHNTHTSAWQETWARYTAIFTGEASLWESQSDQARSSWHQDAFVFSEMRLIHSLKGLSLPNQTPRREALTPNACGITRPERVYGALFRFPLIFSIHLRNLSNADQKRSTCAWSWHDAYEHRPWRPWPRRHAWRESGRTRSILLVSILKGKLVVEEETYGLILDLLSLSPLEGGTVALVLETLGSDEPLDLGGLGVRLLALALGLDFATDDVLADLFGGVISLSKTIQSTGTLHRCFLASRPPHVSSRGCSRGRLARGELSPEREEKAKKNSGVCSHSTWPAIAEGRGRR